LSNCVYDGSGSAQIIGPAVTLCSVVYETHVQAVRLILLWVILLSATDLEGTVNTTGNDRTQYAGGVLLTICMLPISPLVALNLHTLLILPESYIAR
jgi:hypothetical protein